MKTDRVKATAMALSLTAFMFLVPNHAWAHCDTMDGPVVKAAQKALTEGNIELVLLWVQKADEPEIKQAFGRTLAVRKLGPEARELADHYFFETLVRVHRAGEGAPYTGLKPAGTDLGPAIPAADKALETKDAARLLSLLSGRLNEGVQERFKTAVAKAGFRPGDVAAGREYVRAYVEFVHYVEGIHSALAPASHGHELKSEGEAVSPLEAKAETHQTTPSPHQHLHK